jgi:hypothetical protein
VEIKNRFAALESSDKSMDINSAWESIRGNIKTSAKENVGYHRLKHNKAWLDDESNGSRLITMVAKSKPNQWRYYEKFKT